MYKHQYKQQAQTFVCKCDVVAEANLIDASDHLELASAFRLAVLIAEKLLVRFDCFVEDRTRMFQTHVALSYNH